MCRITMTLPEFAQVSERTMAQRDTLTAKEIELLRRLSRGLSNQEIARHMSITVGTAKGHLYRIFRKLNVRNRTAAVAKARELGVF